MSDDAFAPFLRPGRVELATSPGVPLLRLRGREGTVEFSPHGAHVTAWRPEGQAPVLFLSARSHFAEGRPIRGGVPLVFPWFGPRSADPAAPAHGFARLRPWRLEDATVDADGVARAALTLADDAATRALWPYAFRTRFELEASRRLSLRLSVHNPSDEAFSFEAALHTYFAVTDARACLVHGLEHTEYLDKTDGGRRKRQGGGPIRFTGETDRTYLHTAADCVLEDPGGGRRIRIQKTGAGATVVWNPWIDKARAMPDFGDDEWPGMVCVETAAAADDRVDLAPGASHTLSASYEVERG